MLRTNTSSARQLCLLCLAALLTAVSIVWIDLPLARAIAGLLSSGSTSAVIHSNYPDLLDLFVAVVTLACWLGYIILRYAAPRHRLTSCLCLTGTAVPIANTAKDLAKILCGRINARAWLAQPSNYGFHWLHGSRDFSGFPSGHMAVLTAFGLAIVYYYPRLRTPFGLSLIMLAAILTLSEYHFLGDIIAGAYLGYLAYLAASQVPGVRGAGNLY